MADAPKKKRLVVLQDRPAGDETPPEERPPTQWVIAAAVITVIGWLIVAGTSNAVLQRANIDSPIALVLANVAGLFIAAVAAGFVTARYGVLAGRKHATYGTLSAAAFGWVLSLGGLGETSVAFWLAPLAVMLGIAWAGGVTGYRLGRKKQSRDA